MPDAFTLNLATPEALKELPEMTPARLEALLEGRPFASARALMKMASLDARTLKLWAAKGLGFDFARAPLSPLSEETITALVAGTPLTKAPGAALDAELIRCLTLLCAPPPPACCDRVTSVGVGQPVMQRKLVNRTYETPVNQTFDAADVVRIGFAFTACLPVDIRIRFTRVHDRDESEILSVDKKGVGGNVAGDEGEIVHIKDDTYQFAIEELDLDAELFVFDEPPRAYVLTVLVRDTCGRLGLAAARLTLTDFG